MNTFPAISNANEELLAQVYAPEDDTVVNRVIVALDRVRLSYDEEGDQQAEDRIMTLLDRVTGFCREGYEITI